MWKWWKESIPFDCVNKKCSSSSSSCESGIRLIGGRRKKLWGEWKEYMHFLLKVFIGYKFIFGGKDFICWQFFLVLEVFFLFVENLIFILWRWIQQRSFANSGVELHLGRWGFSKSGQKIFIVIIMIKLVFKIPNRFATFSNWKLGFQNWVTSWLTLVAEDENNAICDNKKYFCGTCGWMAFSGRSRLTWFWFLKKHTWQLEYRSNAYRTSGQAHVSILMRESHTYKSHLWSQSTW